MDLTLERRRACAAHKITVRLQRSVEPGSSLRSERGIPKRNETCGRAGEEQVLLSRELQGEEAETEKEEEAVVVSRARPQMQRATKTVNLPVSGSAEGMERAMTREESREGGRQRLQQVPELFDSVETTTSDVDLVISMMELIREQNDRAEYNTGGSGGKRSGERGVGGDSWPRSHTGDVELKNLQVHSLPSTESGAGISEIQNCSGVANTLQIPPSEYFRQATAVWNVNDKLPHYGIVAESQQYGNVEATFTSPKSSDLLPPGGVFVDVCMCAGAGVWAHVQTNTVYM